MTEAGYNPKASIDVMKEIQSINDSEPGALEIWFMTHPPTSERIDLLNEELKSLESQDPDITERKIQRNAFISLLDGMAVGEWNGKELVRGDRYYNKEYMLSIPVPEGWQVQITNDNYTAVFYDKKQESFSYFNVQPLRERKTSDIFFNELSKVLSGQGLDRVNEDPNNRQYSHGAIAGIYQGNPSPSCRASSRERRPSSRATRSWAIERQIATTASARGRALTRPSALVNARPKSRCAASTSPMAM